MAAFFSDVCTSRIESHEDDVGMLSPGAAIGSKQTPARGMRLDASVKSYYKMVPLDEGGKLVGMHCSHNRVI